MANIKSTTNKRPNNSTESLVPVMFSVTTVYKVSSIDLVYLVVFSRQDVSEPEILTCRCFVLLLNTCEIKISNSTCQ